jgi:hypothetical protein
VIWDEDLIAKVSGWLSSVIATIFQRKKGDLRQELSESSAIWRRHAIDD